MLSSRLFVVSCRVANPRGVCSWLGEHYKTPVPSCEMKGRAWMVFIRPRFHPCCLFFRRSAASSLSPLPGMNRPLDAARYRARTAVGREVVFHPRLTRSHQPRALLEPVRKKRVLRHSWDGAIIRLKNRKCQANLAPKTPVGYFSGKGLTKQRNKDILTITEYLIQSG